ncbi:MAG TPA: hypothetical protein VJ228_06730 [Candidatus Acidoferrales bacterium]|jgi:hypothetical protein|nr:hypothetical protein [Candidatus Acidoferrales bacterium]
MRPKLLAGLFAVALLAVPAGVQAQRGGMGGGGRAAAPSGGMSFAGVAPHAGNIRSVSSVPVANGPSVARPHAANPFSAYGVQTPYRASGMPGSPTMGIREPHSRGVGAGNHHHHPHQPKGTNPGFYFLTGGGYWYAGPGLVDDAEGQPEGADGQESIEGQQADDPQQQPPDEEQRDARADVNSAPAPEPQEAAPLPDVGSFTLVMRDGTQVDALAFTRAQDKIIYITPDGGRRTVAVRDIDSNSTERLNQERGTPLQLPL